MKKILLAIDAINADKKYLRICLLPGPDDKIKSNRSVFGESCSRGKTIVKTNAGNGLYGLGGILKI